MAMEVVVKNRRWETRGREANRSMDRKWSVRNFHDSTVSEMTHQSHWCATFVSPRSPYSQPHSPGSLSVLAFSIDSCCFFLPDVAQSSYRVRLLSADYYQGRSSQDDKLNVLAVALRTSIELAALKVLVSH